MRIHAEDPVIDLTALVRTADGGLERAGEVCRNGRNVFVIEANQEFCFKLQTTGDWSYGCRLRLGGKLLVGIAFDMTLCPGDDNSVMLYHKTGAGARAMFRGVPVAEDAPQTGAGVAPGFVIQVYDNVVVGTAAGVVAMADPARVTQNTVGTAKSRPSLTVARGSVADDGARREILFGTFPVTQRCYACEFSVETSEKVIVSRMIDVSDARDLAQTNRGDRALRASATAVNAMARVFTHDEKTLAERLRAKLAAYRGAPIVLRRDLSRLSPLQREVVARYAQQQHAQAQQQHSQQQQPKRARETYVVIDGQRHEVDPAALQTALQTALQRLVKKRTA